MGRATPKGSKAEGHSQSQRAAHGPRRCLRRIDQQTGLQTPPSPMKKLSTSSEGRHRHIHFDPDIVEAFLDIKETFRNIALTFADCNEERNMLGGKDRIGGFGKSIEHILLVEDNEINLEIMLSQLTSLGYNVETAVNGKEALVKLQRNTYDVILTDIKMPVMDGYELAAEIQKLEKDTKDPTPVFAITASDFDLNDELAKSLGFTGYMLKPLDLDLLKKKLAHIGFNGKPWV